MTSFVLAILAAILCFAAGAYFYRRGVKDGLSIGKTGQVELPVKKTEAPLEEDEETKTLLAAIEAYNGTNCGEV